MRRCRSPGESPPVPCSSRCGCAVAPARPRACRWSGGSIPASCSRTALKKLVSLAVGTQSDRRIVQALAARRQEFYDHSLHYRDGGRGPQPDRSRPRDELWVDFVCDTGDGWNSTYAVAYAAAQRALRVHDGEAVHDLPRGDVLVFGGDEVYPAPSREEYQRRLVAPYAAAFGDDEPAERPHVYAVPGNHDWYDGLSAFTRLFCSDIGGRRFAGWWTRQRRSYFVLKLPHRWWLVASDGQLQSDLDVPQMEHFREIAERHMQPGDKVVLCLSLPVWILRAEVPQHGTRLRRDRSHLPARGGVREARHHRQALPDGRPAPLPAPRGVARVGRRRRADSEDHGWRWRRLPPPDARGRLLAAERGGRDRRHPGAHLRGALDLPVDRPVGAAGLAQPAVPAAQPAFRGRARHGLPDDGVARGRGRRRHDAGQPVAGPRADGAGLQRQPRTGAVVRRHRARVPGVHRHAQPALSRARRAGARGRALHRDLLSGLGSARHRRPPRRMLAAWRTPPWPGSASSPAAG